MPLSLPERVHWLRGVAAMPDLGASALRVAIVFVDRQNSLTGQLNPGIACLVRDTGVDRRTVVRAVRTLEERGAIRVTRCHGHSNHYELCPPAEVDQGQAPGGDIRATPGGGIPATQNQEAEPTLSATPDPEPEALPEPEVCLTQPTVITAAPLPAAMPDEYRLIAESRPELDLVLLWAKFVAFYVETRQTPAQWRATWRRWVASERPCRSPSEPLKRSGVDINQVQSASWLPPPPDVLRPAPAGPRSRPNWSGLEIRLAA